METLFYWCVSSALVLMAMSLLTVAFLRSGGPSHFKNRRSAEIEWQRRNRNTDWWLEIDKDT